MATSKTSGKSKTRTETKKRMAKFEATSLASDMQTTPAEVNRDAVADLAYQLFLQRGARHGHDLDDWVTAERQLGISAS